MTGGPPPSEVLVDANVLLRLFTGKPVAQAKAAQLLMQRADDGDVRLRVCPVVVAEVVWVLTSYYEQPPRLVTDTLTAFLSAGGLVIEEGLQVIAALDTMATTGVDFIDAYLAHRARLAQSSIASFDRDFDKLDVERLALAPS